MPASDRRYLGGADDEPARQRNGVSLAGGSPVLARPGANAVSLHRQAHRQQLPLPRKKYSMGIHGFAAAYEFTPEEQSNEKLVLSLSRSVDTLRQYPFDFSLRISFQLIHNTDQIQSTITLI